MTCADVDEGGCGDVGEAAGSCELQPIGVELAPAWQAGTFLTWGQMRCGAIGSHVNLETTVQTTAPRVSTMHTAAVYFGAR